MKMLDIIALVLTFISGMVIGDIINFMGFAADMIQKAGALRERFAKVKKDDVRNSRWDNLW